MTAAPSADRAAASRLVAALEHAWTAIRTRHPEVPQAVIVVASGSDARSRRLDLGHFAAGRWQLTSPDQPTDRPEVLVSGEGLQRGPVEVLGTLLHEAAHGLAHARTVSDTSRQGRYHNRRYATLAGELGLEVTHLDPIGWSATSVPDPTAACYAKVLAELGAALVLWRRAEQPAPAGPGRSRNPLACSCACGRRIRWPARKRTAVVIVSLLRWLAGLAARRAAKVGCRRARVGVEYSDAGHQRRTCDPRPTRPGQAGGLAGRRLGC
jgi:hypothetical protein